MMLRLRGVSKHVILTVSAFLTAAGLFSVPLILRYHVYKDYAISLTSSDFVPVNEWISPLWCSGQSLSTVNSTTFNAFMMSSAPGLTTEVKRSTFVERVMLRTGQTEHWGFRLIEGSMVKMTFCAKMAGATVSVIRGHRTLNSCMKEHYEDNSEESSESESDSLESTVSSSEGVFSNETSEEEFECDQALNQQEIAHYYNCGQTGSLEKDPSALNSNETIEFTASETDRYYVVFSNAAILDLLPNEIHFKFEFERIVYETNNSDANCTDSNECSFPFTVDHKQFVVVELNSGENPKLISDVLMSKCLPRKGIYFIFYLLLFIVIFISAFQ